MQRRVTSDGSAFCMSHEIATALQNALKRLESFEMAQGHLERPGIRFIYALCYYEGHSAGR